MDSFKGHYKDTIFGPGFRAASGAGTAFTSRALL